jgi:glutamate racemase
MPQYDYLYIGDNARAPYGTRSFDVVYEFTRQAVKFLFQSGCHLVILACNTASAKALRTIQQKDLPELDPTKRVLGVIRPSVEALANYSSSGHIGILATAGTIASRSYPLEIEKLYGKNRYQMTQLACPMWVPLVENNELIGDGADYFVKKYLDQLFNEDPQIDTLILGCTHYPLLRPLIERMVGPDVKIISQGNIVAHSLLDYLGRHPEIEERLGKESKICYYTTDQTDVFEKMAAVFMGEQVTCMNLHLS